jgi:fatty-acyl-CoA synthase
MSVEITRQETYLDKLLGLFASGGDREAIVYCDRRLSYAQAHDQILRLANALRRSGLDRGDAIAVLVGNRPDSVLLEFAVHLIGCQLVFMPPELGMTRLEAFARQVDAKAFVFDPDFDPGFDPGGEELTRLGTSPIVLSLGPAGAGEDLLLLADAEAATRPDVGICPDDVATVLYSGGTTGVSKLVTHGHNFQTGLTFAAARLSAEGLGQPRTLVCTLVTHTSGYVSAVMTFLAEGTLVLMDGFDAGEAIRLIGQERITVLSLVPPELYEILDHPDCPLGGFPSIRRIFYGGAPTAPSRVRQAVERFGTVMRQSYGLTEVPVITILEPEEHDLAKPERLSSCGRPFPGTVVEVRDDEGQPVAARVVGEVHARSLMVAQGYSGGGAEADEQIGNGWVRTGDLGYFDEDGYLYLVDRSKDVIVTTPVADNVFSRLLDDFLSGLAGIRDAATVGIPDRGHGEKVHVFLVPSPGADPDLADLQRQVVHALGKQYRPDSFTLVDSLPRTTVGKIDKKALRARLTD